MHLEALSGPQIAAITSQAGDKPLLWLLTYERENADNTKTTTQAYVSYPLTSSQTQAFQFGLRFQKAGSVVGEFVSMVPASWDAIQGGKPVLMLSVQGQADETWEQI